MGFSHGKNAVTKIDNAAGQLVDISAITNSTEMPQVTETSETTGFGKNNKTYITGLSDSTVTISGYLDDVQDAMLTDAHAALIDGTVDSLTIEYYPGGITKPGRRAEMIITSYGPTSGVADANTFSLEGQVTGPVERIAPA